MRPSLTERALADTVGEPPTLHEPASADAPVVWSAIESPLFQGAERERYTPAALIGAGGMGEVWAFQDKRVGREIALKQLRRGVGGEAMERRFLREARVQAVLEHPAVPPVYDLGVREDGSLFFTMRKIRGRTLEQVLRDLASGVAATEALWSRRKLLNAFVQVCLAAHYAHIRGVLHRDLKPSNIMLGDYGEVYVLDWGIARVSGDPVEVPGTLGVSDASPLEEARALTAAGAVLGTPGYMAPEQLRGRHDQLDARSDVYALGVILFELLALRPMHEGRSLGEVLERTLDGHLGLPSSVDADVPPELDTVFARATAHEQASRFESARALADAIEAFLDGDRDDEKRRALADVHATRAKEATERMRSADLAAPDAETARSGALSDVMKSLALQPEHLEARRALVDLLFDVPEVMPAHVQDTLHERTRVGRADAARWAMVFFLLWAGVIPLGLAFTVRDGRPLVALGVICALGLGMAYMIRREGGADPWRFGFATMMVYAAVCMLSGWLGPFIVAPAGCSVALVLSASRTRGRERLAHVVMGTVFLLLPSMLELLDVFSPAYEIAADRMILFARTVELPPSLTLAVLIYATVSTGLLPAVYFARLRDALDQAESRLILHSWHLNRLAGDAGPPSVAELPADPLSARRSGAPV